MSVAKQCRQNWLPKMDMINGIIDFLIHSTSFSSFLMKEISFIYDTILFFSEFFPLIFIISKLLDCFATGNKMEELIVFPDFKLEIKWNRFLISRISFFLFSLITTTQNVQTENLQSNCYFDLFFSDVAIRACWYNWSIHAGSQIIYLSWCRIIFGIHDCREIGNWSPQPSEIDRGINIDVWIPDLGSWNLKPETWILKKNSVHYCFQYDKTAYC